MARSPVQYVATQGEVELAVSVTGVDDGEPATFHVKKAADHSELATVDGTIENGRAVATWAPDLGPDAGDRGIRVYYTVEAGGRTTRAPELEVYLDWIEITSQDEAGNALPDVPYVLKVGEHTREGTTGSSGTHREVDVPPGAVRFEWRGPYELVDWVDQAGPTRIAKLKKIARMQFVWPSPEAGGGRRWWFDDGSEFPLHERFFAHTQLTNHARTPDHPERGERLTVRVSAYPPEQGVAGQKVYVKAEWPAAANLSKRNRPARELVRGSNKPWAQGPTLKGLELTLPADGGEVSFDVVVGLAGGDQVTLYLGCTTRCEDAKLVITNARKVYYQPTVRTGLTVPDLTRSHDWLLNGAVEAEADGAPVQVAAGPAVTGGGAGKGGMTLVPKRWFWNYEGDTPPAGDDMIVGHHNWMHFQEDVFTNRGGHGRLAVNLVYVDRVVHGTQGDGTSPFFQRFDVPVTGDPVPLINIPLPGGFTLFNQAVHDGGYPIREITWRGPASGVPAALRNKRGTIPPAWIDLTPEGATSFVVAFPGEDTAGASEEDKVPGRIIAAGGTVRVRGTAYVCSTGFAGWSRGKQIALADAEGRASQASLGYSAEDIANMLFSHELGHNMHQACARDPSWPGARAFCVPPGMGWDDHPFGYRGHGHVGGHCSFGMADADRSRSSYSGLTTAQRGTCIMYGQMSDPGRLVATGYCEHCIKFLKGYDMRSVQSE